MASLADIRARIAAQDTKQNRNSSGSGSDNAIYPHWNISEGATATVRFLPDSDTNNTFFWVERQIIKLPFNGVKGDSNSKQTIVQVPCVEMYGENCPVLAEIRPWYKDETLKDLANKYWKKRSYLFQGFVRTNPMADDKVPANPIRRFVISPQIFTIIKSSLMDPELEELPTDYMHGIDFNVKKTAKGDYADYSTSNWSRRESPLTEVEQAAIEAHGLFNLKDFLPKKPSDAEINVIKEMFQASVDGRPYDAEKWGSYYRPYGLEVSDSTSASTSENTKVVTGNTSPIEDASRETSEPVKVPQPDTNKSSDKAADILAMIKARQQKN